MLKMLRALADAKVILLVVTIVVLAFAFENELILICGLSYAFHLVNLDAFMFRSCNLQSFIARALLLRTLAFATIIYLFIPFIHSEINFWCGIPLVVGLILQMFSVRALGLERTYYGVELGELQQDKITSFPYSAVPHPMHIGVFLQFLALYLFSPAFTAEYPYLILGHLVFTLITVIVEHFDIHFKNYFFKATYGKIDDSQQKQNIDAINQWSLEHFASYLHRECSAHRYIKTLPEDIRNLIDTVRYSNKITEAIKGQYPNCKIIPLPMTDEFYISRYNYDKGGDQGLFDKHYDGNLRSFPSMSVVRSLIYLSSDDNLEVVFDTSDVKKAMKTYDFAILDFHKELHWVEGTYQPENPPRILLKCNYYLDHGGAKLAQKIKIWVNIVVFYVVKAAMEYSKSPKTLTQKIIGFFCNFFRRLNIINPALPLLFVFSTIFIIFRIIIMR